MPLARTEGRLEWVGGVNRSEEVHTVDRSWEVLLKQVQRWDESQGNTS